MEIAIDRTGYVRGPRRNVCSVVGCYSNSIEGFRIFVFPSSVDQCTKWTNFAKCEDVRRHRRFMCPRHFRDSDFTTHEKIRLNRGAVPSLCAPPTEPPQFSAPDTSPPSSDPISNLVDTPMLRINPVPKCTFSDSFPGPSTSSTPIHQHLPEHQEYDLFSESASPSVDPLAEDCPSSGKAESVKKLCRLCTELAGENAMNLFVEKYLGREIFAMLNTLLPDTFTEMDGLSQLVCTACVNKVYLCYATVQTFVSADKILREMLKDQQKGEMLEPQDVVSKEDTSGVTNGRTSELIMSNVEVLLNNNSPQNESTLMCSGCKKLFTDPSLAQQHKHMKCNGRVNPIRVKFKCSLCEKLFSQESSLLEHKSLHRNPPNLLICHICGKTLKHVSNMNRHLQNHEKKEYVGKREKKIDHICHICSRVFKRKRSFDKHRHRQKHEKKKSEGKQDMKLENTCHICRRVFKSKKYFDMHLLKHEREPLSYICSICSLVCKNLGSLRIHEKRHEDRLVPASCPLCKKNLRSKLHLKSHLTWAHSGKRKRLCHLCGKLLYSDQAFKIHLRKHTGLNINMNQGCFKCLLCDRSFRWESQLSSHVLRHTGVKEFRCTTCNKEFYSKERLRRHSLTHTTLRIHKCDACLKAFKTKRTLMSHKARGCNPVKRSLLCSICDINLPSVTDLKKHQKEKHSSHELSEACNSLENIVSLDYLCTVCNDGFASQNELLIHKHTLHSTESSPSEPDVDADNQELVYPQNRFYH